MRPFQSSAQQIALLQLIQLAQTICGQKLRSHNDILAQLADVQKIEVWAIPKDPEPGLDRVLIARIDLEGHPSCR